MKSPTEIDLPVSRCSASCQTASTRTSHPFASCSPRNTPRKLRRSARTRRSTTWSSTSKTGCRYQRTCPSGQRSLGGLICLSSRSSGCVISHNAIEVAARRDHLHLVKYIWYTGSLCTQCACIGASSGGKLHVLQWLFPEDKWFPDLVDMSRMLV